MDNVRFEKLNIANAPALVYGEKAESVYIFVHGKKGNKEEGKFLAQTACERGYQVLSFDLPGHGARIPRKEPFDFHATDDLKAVMKYAKERWEKIYVYANSIGAWLSMVAFRDTPPEKYLFVSPLVDMEEFIVGMMARAQVTEQELGRWKNVPTSDGNTISLEYLHFSRDNPAVIGSSTACAILYGENDKLIGREAVETFARRFGCTLTVVPGAEHWFHTPPQMEALRVWLEANV